jgi:hypothetical protein
MTSDASKLPGKTDPIAADLRGFGPLGITAIFVILAGQLLAPLSAVLVLIWAKWSQTPWHEIGYVRPRSWFGGLVAGVAFGIAFKFLMKAIVMPLFGADPLNQTYHYLVGNGTAALATVPLMVVTAGFGEVLSRLFVRAIRQADRTKFGREGADCAFYNCSFCVASLFRSGTGRRPAGGDNRACVWNDLRIDGRGLVPTRCARASSRV